MRSTLLRLVLLSTLICIAAHSADAEACALAPGDRHAVVRVIDAETIALDDGGEVRLIGALPTRDPDGASNGSAAAMLEDAVRGRSVEIRFGGRKSDRYGRRLAHVYAVQGETQVWLQGQLIESGFARAYALPGSDACLKDMLAKEQLARVSERGLWSNPANRVLTSDQTRQLMALRGRFAVVEGKVQNVGGSGGRVYLNFGSDWRQDFTAAVPPSILRAKPEAQKLLHSLEGRSIRVRGWIERRNGPLVELSSLDEIEVLDGPAASAEADDEAQN